MNIMEKTLHKLSTFRKELEEGMEALPEKLNPQSIRILADIAAIFSALCHYRDEPHGMESHTMDTGWKDNIIDELESAEEKYRQYQRSKDPIMLEIARDELRHGAYYLNHAKMSTDAKLREKLPEYQIIYDRLEKEIRAPHGNEKLPVL